MATPSIIQVDDRDPRIIYTPDSGWTKGGNVADFDATSTFTAVEGATASITFTGTSIGVYGTIQYLVPNIATHTLSSYSIDGGPATTFDATEQAAFQFQQKYFDSGELTPTSHTLVVTHIANNSTFFIDYFLITTGTLGEGSSPPPSSPSAPPSPPSTTNTPAGTAGTKSASNSASSASSLSGSSSLPGSATTPGTSGTIHGTSANSVPNPTSPTSFDSSSLPSISTTPHSSSIPVGAIVGGILGALALLLMAIFALWFSRRRRKDNRPIRSQPHSDPQSPVLPMEQYQPYDASHRLEQSVSSPYTVHRPTLPALSSGIVPPSKAAQAFSVSSDPLEYYSSARTFSGSPEPPEYSR